MPRACTTLDSFNAVAEPQRRRVLDLLQNGERPVNEMVISRWGCRSRRSPSILVCFGKLGWSTSASRAGSACINLSSDKLFSPSTNG